MTTKALTKDALEEEDTALLLQVELMGNNTAQDIGLSSSKGKKLTWSKKHVKTSPMLEQSSYCSAAVHISDFSTSYKMKPKKNYQH